MEQSFLTVMPEWNFAVSSIVSLTQEVSVLLMSLHATCLELVGK